MFFLPSWPLQADAILLAALTLVSAALAGEGLFKFFGWPRIIGYSLIGMIAGAMGFAIQAGTLVRDRSAFAIVFDMGMALLLFEVGGRVNLSWLRANP